MTRGFGEDCSYLFNSSGKGSMNLDSLIEDDENGTRYSHWPKHHKKVKKRPFVAF